MNNFVKFATFYNCSKARLYKENINNFAINFDLTSSFFDNDHSAFLLDYQRIIASASFGHLQYKAKSKILLWFKIHPNFAYNNPACQIIKNLKVVLRQLP